MQSERKFSIDMLISSLIAVLCVVMFTASISMSAETKLFPQTISAVVFIFCVYHAGTKFLSLPKPGGKEKPMDGGRQLNHVFLVVIAFLYVVLLQPVGFLISTTALLIGLPVTLGNRRLSVIVPVALIASIVLYLIFKKGFYVNLSSGLIPFF